jgi:hypothetical protein
VTDVDDTMPPSVPARAYPRLGPCRPSREITDETQAREKQHQRPEQSRTNAAERAVRTLGQERQNDQRHDGESCARAHFNEVEFRNESVELAFLDQQQEGERDDGGRDAIVSCSGQHAGRKNDERGNFGGAVNVGSARGLIRHDNESAKSREKDDGGTREACVPQPSAQSGDESQQRERAQTGESGARAFGFAAPLTLEADGHPAERRDGDVPERRGVDRHAFRLIRLRARAGPECPQALFEVIGAAGNADSEVCVRFEEGSRRDGDAIIEKRLHEER